MEILAGFFCSKLFISYIAAGVALCISGICLFFLIIPEGARKHASDLNEFFMWFILIIFVAGVIFLWLPALLALLAKELLDKWRCSKAELLLK
ncbi:MAG: hypothetical protein WCZ08_00210 [Parcubacteria group bacterium]|jgi:nitric oxide reductase large subunit|nr:hypothetical protein [Candidatus Moranbacteria bacterium]